MPKGGGLHPQAGPLIPCCPLPTQFQGPPKDIYGASFVLLSKQLLLFT